MKALVICETLLDAIKRKDIVKGHVHSVFNSACNIETEHEFITLLDSDKNMAPMSILIDKQGQVNFRDLKITQNSEFTFSVNDIYNYENDIFISLDNVQTWTPGALLKSSKCREKKILENIKVLEIGLSVHGKFYGIGPLISLLCDEFPDLELKYFNIYPYDKTFEFIKYRFINFVKGLLEMDIKRIADRAESIIGFGPGLTPAMDDFISGLMISFIYIGNYYDLNLSQIYKLNKNIISQSLNKTTKVSSEMLKHAAVGEVNESARQLMMSIINYSDEESIILSLLNTISYGETSGTDTALGIYVGCKIITNIKYRRVYLNESLRRY